MVAGAAADLLSKRWAYYALEDPATRWPLHRIEELQRRLMVLDLLWQPNWGAVFGVGHGQTALFIAFTFLALGLLTWLFIESRKGHLWLQIFLACVVAGALGNLYDRIQFGHVRDFLRLNFRADWASWGGPEHYLWPYVFNIADVFITVGVGGLFLVWLIALVRHRGERPAPRSGKR